MEQLDSNKCVVILSGGMDSTTLVYELHKGGMKVLPLSINYGQRHCRELGFARNIAFDLKLRWKVVGLNTLRQIMRGSSQTDEVAVPQGHYADESMKVTVVPNRNMIMLAVAGAYAISEGAASIAYAAHSGDHAIYPDCRPEFVNFMRMSFQACHFEPLTLLAPYLHISKTEIVTRGEKLGVPWSDTWSCYEGRSLHCGKCGTCVERREAFQIAGVIDPTVYEV